MNLATEDHYAERTADFISGKLSAEEHLEYEQALRAYPGLRRRFYQLKDLARYAVDHPPDARRAAHLQQLFNDHADALSAGADRAVRKPFPWRAVAAVAALVIGIMLLFHLLIPNSVTLPSTTLLTEPYPVETLVHARPNTTAERGITAYRDGKFSMAIDSLTALAVKSVSFRFIIGTANYYLQRYDEAEALLKPLEDVDALPREAVRFYLILIQIERDRDQQKFEDLKNLRNAVDDFVRHYARAILHLRQIG